VIVLASGEEVEHKNEVRAILACQAYTVTDIFFFMWPY